ncbi:cell division cycle-associated protein 2 isoform X3 [Channa argus]|uniref:cell division cycle-associated protein 2 isoform X3 n=1 Tax=Channa argus TaxID=215402 RepID=UPI00352055FA
MMSNTEVSTAGTEGVQKEKMLSSSEEPTTALTSNDTSAPLNFSELTPCQFGISVQSFIPASLGRKDTSRLAQIKARRRSSVGVRGSPETNSLIRFMAQQRMKTPPTHQTPENVRRSPFLPRVASTLRQKMASFQSLMDVEESEVSDPMPKQDRNGGGCIKTRDYLSDGNSLDRGKENDPPMMTPTPTKRRCLAPPEGCEVEIREARAPILHFSWKEQEDDVFELQRPSQPPPDDPAAVSPTQLAPIIHISSIQSLLEMKPKAEDESTGTSTVKKKRVHFGGPLSPELFDKNLPPSTPLQKGGTPARAPTPGQSLQLRSVLKTPQRSGSKTPETRQEFSSPTAFGASPILVMPRNSRIKSVGEDSEENDEKIIFPAMEENDCAVMSGAEEMWDTQPLNLNTAFHEESLSQSVTDSAPPESPIKPSATSQKDVLDDPISLSDEETQHEAVVETSATVRSRNQRKKPKPECKPTSEAPARTSSRKRKQLEETEPGKRSTRSAAKSAAGKMKATSTTTRRWNKDVDRSLYGSREYASKNPKLSPITERLSFISQSPAVLQTPSTICTVPGHEPNNTQATGDCNVTNALKSPSVASPHCSKGSTTGKTRRLSGPRVGGRGLKKRKVSVDSHLLNEEPQDQTEGDTESRSEDRTTTDETLLKPTQQAGIAIEPNGQTFAEVPSTDSEKTSECHTSLSACLSSGEELGYTSNLPAGPAQIQAKRGRRHSVKSSVIQEQRDEVEDHQMSCAVEEKGQGDQAASQHESRSSSDSQEDRGVANLQLAPWQADFDFEDVFKPVTTRGQCSVRRSLRNRSSAVYNSSSAGLAWVPRTSPESSKEYRRRTLGRRLSLGLPVQTSCPEETEDNTS